MLAAVLVILSYLLGSIPSAYIAGRALRGIDIRKTGDGNMGAANVSRTIGPAIGVLVFFVDVLKGVIAVLVTQAFAPQIIVFLAGFAVVAGHNWPIYIGFRGGRGFSTAIGVLSALLPQAMLILLAVCAIPFLITRNAILAGAIIFAPLWLIALFTGESGALVGYSAALPCLVGFTHFLSVRHRPERVNSGTL